MKIKDAFWFSLQSSSEIFLILRRIERDVIINLPSSSCKVRAILVRFDWNFDILDRFSKKLKYKISWKSARRERSCSMRMDTTKLIVSFRNFANAPERWIFMTCRREYYGVQLFRKLTKHRKVCSEMFVLLQSHTSDMLTNIIS